MRRDAAGHNLVIFRDDIGVPMAEIVLVDPFFTEKYAD
jgi:hypothetical protein